MKKPPPSPLLWGDTTPMQNNDAIAESTAFPPCIKTFLPISEQSPWSVATAADLYIPIGELDGSGQEGESTVACVVGVVLIVVGGNGLEPSLSDLITRYIVRLRVSRTKVVIRNTRTKIKDRSLKEKKFVLLIS